MRPGFDLEGKRVLLPRAAVARDVLPHELRARGACVDVVEAYRAIVPESAGKQVTEYRDLVEKYYRALSDDLR